MTTPAHRRRTRSHREASWSIEPTRVGPYRLCMELASGGMATVYLARSEGATARFAAVKVIHPHLTSEPKFASMFCDEAEIASRIRHANVCHVYDYDVGGSDEVAYIAMEYLIGESMDDVARKLRRGSRDVVHDARILCRALADACEGLHAAHELEDEDGDPLEVVHRDVSPRNVMLTYDGVCKVVDFGVAAAARKRHRTETGMLKGKLAYIAPEYLRGQKADRRCDVWGIGVVAWELVTGERLFRRDSDVDTLRAVMEDPVRPPSEVRPGLPEELDAILMRALDRDPAVRHPTARELGRDLARFANREDVVTTADLSEWLEELFPGAHARRLHELELAGQLAQIGPDEATASSAALLATRPEPEADPTHLYERSTLSEAPIPTPLTPSRRPDSTVQLPRWRSAPGFVGVGLIVGVLSGGAVAHFGADHLAAEQGLVAAEAQPAPAAVRIVEEPRAVQPSEPAGASPSPELRLRPGTGLARGSYVLDVLESGPDELVLRIRHEATPRARALHDAPPNELGPEPARPRSPTMTEPARRSARRPSPPPSADAAEAPTPPPPALPIRVVGGTWDTPPDAPAPELGSVTTALAAP